MKNAVPVELPCACVVLNEPVLRVKIADVLTRYGYAIAGPFELVGRRGLRRDRQARRGGPRLFRPGGRMPEDRPPARLRRAVPLVFYAAPEELKGVPADLKGVPFIAKPDREFLVLKRLSTLHNERLMRRLLNPEIWSLQGAPDASRRIRGGTRRACRTPATGKEKAPGARSDPGLHKARREGRSAGGDETDHRRGCRS